MTQEHPITPPPELIAKWAGAMCGYYEAARWGADQELEACCELVRENDGYDAALGLRDARRPKPPSLKEQALAAFYAIAAGAADTEEFYQNLETIEQALESLPD
jgi:hypothetical protein